MDSSLLTLPTYLLDKIKRLVADDLDLPSDLRNELQTTVSAAESTSVQRVPVVAPEQELLDPDAPPVEDVAPPTIDIELVESLARWASGTEGERSLRRACIDPNEYTLISLLAGTQVYIPPSKLALLNAAHNPDKPNPYLPSHLSARPPPFSGYKALNKQISTILNILFSIGGSGGAVYVAATTGAGYTRESGVILGVLAALVVGIAEMILVWIFVWRVAEGRKKEVEQWKGTSGVGFKEEPKLLQGEDTSEAIIEDKPKVSTVRLRRKELNQQMK